MNRSFAGGGFRPRLEENDNHGVEMELDTFYEKQKLQFLVECEEKVDSSGKIKCQTTDNNGKPLDPVFCSMNETGATCENEAATIKTATKEAAAVPERKSAEELQFEEQLKYISKEVEKKDGKKKPVDWGTWGHNPTVGMTPKADADAKLAKARARAGEEAKAQAAVVAKKLEDARVQKASSRAKHEVEIAEEANPGIFKKNPKPSVKHRGRPGNTNVAVAVEWLNAVEEAKKAHEKLGKALEEKMKVFNKTKDPEARANADARVKTARETYSIADADAKLAEAKVKANEKPGKLNGGGKTAKRKTAKHKTAKRKTTKRKTTKRRGRKVARKTKKY